MSIGLYSNLATLENPMLEMGHFSEHQSELVEALHRYGEPLDLSEILNESFFDQQSRHVEPVNYQIKQPSDDLYFNQYQKRPRINNDLYTRRNLMFEPCSYLNATPNVAPVTNSNYQVLPELSQDFVLPGTVGTSFNIGYPSEKKADSRMCLSAQSVAARERRRRISDKTQELGRLIPGGCKMNTAEMFQNAYKYVKFLQAQIGILGILSSNQGYKASREEEDQMQVLLASPAIEEKFYGLGKCVVPKVMVEALVEDKEIKSSFTISTELDRFIKSLGRWGCS